MTNSMDQLTVPNEHVNFFPSTSSFSPLPTLTTIDNISSTNTDNGLQRVPPSFMIQPSSSYGRTFSHLHFHFLLF